MWTLQVSKKAVLFLFGTLGLLSSVVAKPVDRITVLVNTSAPYAAGVATNTIFVNVFDEDFIAPDAGEVINVQLIDSGSVIAGAISPSSFTTTGQILHGGNTMPFTVFRAGSALTIRASVAVGSVTDDSSAFSVTVGTAARLVVIAPGITHVPGTNPNTTTGVSGSATIQEPNESFAITVILTDNQYNQVSANHSVAFTSGDLITLPGPGTLTSGTGNFNVTITGAQITRTITVTDTTDATVRTGTVDVTTAGPPAEEIFPFPSPFNPYHQNITFQFHLNDSADATIHVRDLFGQDVWERSVSAGRVLSNVTWDGRNEKGTVVATGVYYVILEVGGTIKSKKRFGVVK